MDKDAKGSLAELRVLAKIVASGKIALLPFGGKARYDILIDNCDSTFTRVQVKSGWRNEKYLLFKAYRNNGNRHRTKASYIGSADVFAIYDETTDKVYWMDVFEARADKWLRLDTLDQYEDYDALEANRNGTRLSIEELRV